MTNEASTRDKLIEAALLEIVERGWGGVRTRSVAARAGVNSALVHYHFGSVGNLRLEAAASAFSRLDEAFRPRVSETLAQNLMTLSVELGSIERDDPVWQVLMEVFVQARRDERLADMARGVLETFRAVLRTRLAAAVDRGELDAESDVDGLAVALTAMFDGLGLHVWVDPAIDTERAGAAVAGLLGSGRGEERM
jgi:AcrR family transcriptional regulator